MKLLRFIVIGVFLSTPSAHAQSKAHVAQLDTAVRAALSRCGLTPRLNQTLNRAALEALAGMRTPMALERVGYRAKSAYTLRYTYAGAVGRVEQPLMETCAEFGRATEYGLATNGQRFAVVTATPAAVDMTRYDQWIRAVFEATNRARFQGQKCGGKLMNSAPALVWDQTLAAAATKHVRDMITLNFRGHVNPRDGSRAQQRAAAYGFKGYAGENIQYGAVTATEAVESLLSSPEHCQNLMDPAWTHFGAALGNGSAKTIFPTYWVQVFGLKR